MHHRSNIEIIIKTEIKQRRLSIRMTAKSFNIYSPALMLELGPVGYDLHSLFNGKSIV